MKFLIDAQLPRRLCIWLTQAGHDARHTLDLPQRNRSSDATVIDVAMREQRIVVSKDDDFVRSFHVSGRPTHLLLVSTGNVSNVALEKLMRDNITAICAAFEHSRFVELGCEHLIIRE